MAVLSTPRRISSGRLGLFKITLRWAKGWLATPYNLHKDSDGIYFRHRGKLDQKITAVRLGRAAAAMIFDVPHTGKRP